MSAAVRKDDIASSTPSTSTIGPTQSPDNYSHPSAVQSRPGFRGGQGDSSIDSRTAADEVRKGNLSGVPPAYSTPGANGLSIAPKRPTQATLRTTSLDSSTSVASNSSSVRARMERDISPASLRNLIDKAGSAEALILHLTREKNQFQAQNTQLWALVEKQRALLLGLNKDTERLAKERDKYRKQLQDLQNQSPRRPSTSSKNSLPSTAASLVNNNLSAIPSSQPLHSAPQEPRVNPDAAPSAPRQILEPRPSEPVGHEQPSGGQAQANDRTQLNSNHVPSNSLPNKQTQTSRKAPPKPLKLSQDSGRSAPQPLLSPSDRALLTGEDDSEDEADSRGRRKTREEDDVDRAKSAAREQEARSKSKKSKEPAPETHLPENKPVQPTVAALPTSPRPQHIVSNNKPQGSIHERLIALPLKSPGLPATPRPMGGLASFAGLPMSPRGAPTPLSPRAPKQPIPPPMMSPAPFMDPAVLQRQNQLARQAVVNATAQSAPERLHVHDAASMTEVPPINQDLISKDYPGLLLPPNALPSIDVKVASSRLRPSRHSMLGLRTSEESTVFSLSVFSRASRTELWRLEKIPAALSQLEQQLRSRCTQLPPLPDRKLFQGHSPAIIDARRQAVDTYFEELLDIEIDEQAALVICKFLSTDVLDPAHEPAKFPGVNEESLPQSTSLSGKVVKTGFLSKRGKNFGGWKSRYFVLDSPELKYYDAPGGPHIGTIRILQARIGSQKSEDNPGTDPEDQYRHAFLIQEPKKKDASNYVRHVLCADSDTDRDQWVEALLHYADEHKTGVVVQPIQSTARFIPVQAPATRVGRHSEDLHSASPSPTSASTDLSHEQSFSRTNNISLPMNGKPIQDTSAWGNRAPSQQANREKPVKKGGLFQFRKSASTEALREAAAVPKPRILRHTGYVRAVFGLPLAEAVEYCPPFNVDVQLPAVVHRSIEYLRYRNAANEEGLFRLSGSSVVVKELKERFNTEGDIDLVDEDEYHDVHAVASLFKTYLRELPLPILTRDLHLEFLRVLEKGSHDEHVQQFNALVHRLPTVNYMLLKATSEYLLEVTENASKNKMSVRNIGIVFSPTTNIPTPVFTLFLSDFSAIFEATPEIRDAPDLESQVKRTDIPLASSTLLPADIRSPRHQMFSDISTPAYNQVTFGDTGMAPIASQNTHKAFGSGDHNLNFPVPGYAANDTAANSNNDVSFPAYSVVQPPSDHQRSESEQFEQTYGSLNRLLMPNDPSDDRSNKQKKRESMMF